MPNDRFLEKLVNNGNISSSVSQSDDVKRIHRSNDHDESNLGVGYVLDGNNVPDEEEEDEQISNRSNDALSRVQQLYNGISMDLPDVPNIHSEELMQPRDEQGKAPDISAIHGLFQDESKQSKMETAGYIDPNGVDKVDIKNDSTQKENEAQVEKPERTTITKRGPKPKKRPVEEVKDESTSISNSELVQQQALKSKSVSMDGYSDDDIAKKILAFVCKSTILGLINTHKSEIYTKEYAVRLMQDYVEGKTSSSENPLFKQLIVECVNANVSDPYLGEMTNLVLNYILEN